MAKTAVQIEHDELLASFEFLDGLRQSGKTNMYGATPYLIVEFGYERKKATEILNMWMKSFDSSKSMDQRIEDALK